MERFTILRVILAQLCSRSSLFNWNNWNKLKFETNLKQLKQFGTNLEQFQISAAWAPIKSSFSWNWLLNRHLITQVPSSTLFEIEFPIHWSIFYSISCDFRRLKIVNSSSLPTPLLSVGFLRGAFLELTTVFVLYSDIWFF